MTSLYSRTAETGVMGHHSVLMLLSQVSLDRQRASSQNIEGVLVLMKVLSTTSCQRTSCCFVEFAQMANYYNQTATQHITTTVTRALEKVALYRTLQWKRILAASRSNS